MARNTFNANLGVQLDPSDLLKSTREIKQALGRITGSASEFQKSLDASTARVFAFGATTAVINGVTQSFKALVTTTIEVEKRLIEIKSIFGGTAAEFNNFRESIFQTARSTGQSFDTVASAAAEFARQGLSATETAKRLEAALILTRVSGLDSVKSTQALTAAINGFTSAGLTAEAITNKLIAVDTRFAVSAQDLAEAFSRAGSTAEDAGVSFDELLGIITAVQQTTSRGGSVIGNALKSIFTRLSRSSTIEDLQALGVAIDASQTGVQKLQALSDALAQVSDPTKASQIKELAGGVYQINIVSAALKDLASSSSVFTKATEASANASDEAFQKNAELNKSLAAQINALVAGFTNLAEKIGQLTLAPLLSGLVSVTDSVGKFLNEALDPEKGNKFVQALLQTIGTFLSGPGLVLITTAFFKIFSQVAKYAKEGFKTILEINSKAESLKNIQAGIVNSLATDEKFRRSILNNTISQAQIEKEVEAAIVRENNLLQQREAILKRLAAAAYTAGARGFSQDKGFTGKAGKQLAGGFIPNFAVGKEMEKRAAEQNGYKAGRVYQTRVYDGNGGSFNSFVNSKEDIQTFRNDKGKRATLVRPPNGFSKNTEIARGFASGFIPNFAPRKVNAPIFSSLNSQNDKVLQGYANYAGTDPNGRKRAELSKEILKGRQDKALTLDATSIIGQQLPTVLAPTGGASIGGIKQGKKFGNDQINFAFSGYTLNQGGIDSLQAEFEKSFSDQAINEFAQNTALKAAQSVASAVQRDPATPRDISEVENVKGFVSSVRGAFGGIFDAAVSSALKIKSKTDPNEGDFDIRGLSGKQAQDIQTLFGSAALPKSGLSDFKIGFGGNTPGSMVDKTYKEYKGVIDNYLKQKNQLEGGKVKGGKASGYIPNFAKYIYDSDRIAPDKGATLKAILSSKARKNLIIGPAGSGKSTLAGKFGKFISGINDVASATEIDILSGAARTKAGGISKNLEALIAAANASGGKVSYLYTKNLDILSRRAGRVNPDSGDLRSKKQLAGTTYAPLNQFDFMKYVKSKSSNFTLVNGAAGFIPNFADPLKEAIGREMSAGVPASQIYVDRNSSLKSPMNPDGLMVANRRDEPNGGIQGINRARKEGINPKRYGSAGGYIPNFAIKADGGGLGKVFGGFFDSVAKTQGALLSLSIASNTLSGGQGEFNEKLQTGIAILSTLDVLRSVGGGFKGIGDILTKVGPRFTSLGTTIAKFLPTFARIATVAGGPWTALIAGVVGLGLTLKKFNDEAEKRIAESEKSLADAQRKFAVNQQVQKIGGAGFADRFRGEGVASGRANKLGFDQFIKTLNREGQGDAANQILKAAEAYKEAAKGEDQAAINQALKDYEEAVKAGREAISEHALSIKEEQRQRQASFESLNNALISFQDQLSKTSSRLGQFQTNVDIAKTVGVDTNTPQGKLTDQLLKLREGAIKTEQSKVDLQTLFAGADFAKLLATRNEQTGGGLLTERIKTATTSPALSNEILKTYFQKGAEGLKQGLQDIIGVDLAPAEGGQQFIQKVTDAAEQFKQNIIQTYGEGKEGIRGLQAEEKKVREEIFKIEQQREALIKKAFDALPAKLNELANVERVDPTELLRGYRGVSQERDPFKAAELLRGLQAIEDRFVALRGEGARDQLRQAGGLSQSITKALQEAIALSRIDVGGVQKLLPNIRPDLSASTREEVKQGQLSERGFDEVITALEQAARSSNEILAKSAREQLAALKATRGGSADEATRTQDKELANQQKELSVKGEELTKAIDILKSNVEAFGRNFESSGLPAAVTSLQEAVIGAQSDFNKFADLGKQLGNISQQVGPVLGQIQKDLAAVANTANQALQTANSVTR